MSNTKKNMIFRDIKAEIDILRNYFLKICFILISSHGCHVSRAWCLESDDTETEYFYEGFCGSNLCNLSHIFAVECWPSCVCITVSADLVRKRNRSCSVFVEVDTRGHLYNRSKHEKNDREWQRK